MKIIRKNLKVFLIILSLMISSLSFAQEISLQGKVTDQESGEPLPGVTIVIKGTTVGTITNFDGIYNLNVEKGLTLQFSYIGYTSIEMVVSDQTTMNVELTLDTEQLGEVVVIGYGQVKKEDATGSVTAVTADDFNVGAITSPQELVSGKIAGVQITSGGGAPGSETTIRIRGGSSLSASNDPLIVIDGVPVDNEDIDGMRNPLNTIHPNDIETFTVLKDASATAIYGSRASNGVIIITTKKGKKGAGLKFSYNGYTSISSKSGEIEVLSSDEFREAVVTELGADSKAASLLGSANTNWQDEIYRTAVSMDHNFSVTGNIKEMPFRASVGYSDQKGILDTDELNRYTASVGFSPSFFEDHLKINLNLKGMIIDNNFGNDDAIGSAISFDPTKPVYDSSSAYGGFFLWQQPNGDPNTLAPSNPVALLMLKEDKSTVKRSIGNLQLDYKFHFLPQLRATLNVGYDYSDSEGTNIDANEASWTFSNDGGYYNEYTQDKKNELLDFYMTYTRQLDAIESRFDLMGGYSWQHFWRESFSFATNGDGSKNIDLPNYDPTESYLVSFFGRLNYILKEKYLLTLTVRRDGTSRFSPDTRWGTFPAAAFAWQIKDEPFMQNLTFVSDLKLRMGYGITGQQNITDDDYPYLPLYTYSLDNARYQFGDNYITTIRPQGYDANIKWEETTTYNIGVDYGLFDNRLTGAIEAYYRKTNDLINTIPVPAGTNLVNELLTNVGDLENKGIEFSVIGRPISKQDLSWEVGFNASFNENKITKLTAIDDPNYLGVPTGDISGGVGNKIQIHSIGQPASSFYVYEQVYDESQKPIEGLYVDRNGDGEITSDDRYHYHKAAPDVFMGFNSKLLWKNWDFSFSGRVSLGNYVYNNIWSSNASLNNLYWSTDYMNNVPKNALNTRFQNPKFFSDYYVTDGSFLRMDNISLGYTIKEAFNDKLNIRVYSTVQNAFMITKYDGLDPEVSDGIDNNIYPRPRIFMIGVSIDY